MQRVAVIGSSCAGKTTFARALAARLHCPHIELDAIHWGPNWTEKPRDVVRREVEHLTQAESWVSCGNYSFLRDVVWTRADTIVWLNYSFPVVWLRALRRTVVRSLQREELWSGNRESLSRALFSRDSILLWILKTYRSRRRENHRLLDSPEYAHHRIIELKRTADADRLLQEADRVAADHAG